MNLKTIFGTLAGGLAFFFSGWLIYGVLLRSPMTEHDSNGLMRKPEEMIWWALIGSNLVWGFFVTWIMQSRSTSGWKQGMLYGAAIGLISTFAFDLGMYAMSKVFPDLMGVFFDTAASAVMFMIAGAVVGMVIKDKQMRGESNKG